MKLVAKSISENFNKANSVIFETEAGDGIILHLIEQGYRRIMHLSGNLLRNVYTERLRGYRYALYEGGLKFDDVLLVISEQNNELSESLE